MIIVVPYRDRFAHLAQFVPHMLRRFPDAEIVVVEQTIGKPFNRGKLLNIGFMEFPTKEYYVFHDVDMLPIQADYSKPVNPTHIATKAEQFGFKMPFADYFGGVTLFTPEDFARCNGYPNNMWGWGGEDDKLRKSVLAAGMTIDSRECSFRSLPHPRKIIASLHQKNIEILQQGGPELDGLMEIKYSVVNKEHCDGYLKLTVEI